MRKFVSAIITAFVFSASFVGALSVLPHGHGHDLDHSQHETCPIHQQSFQGHATAVEAGPIFGPAFFVEFIPSIRQDFQFISAGRFVSLRAPPLF